MMIKGRPRTGFLVAAGCVAAILAVVGVYLWAAPGSGTAPAGSNASAPGSGAHGVDGRKVRVGDHELFVVCQGSGTPAVILDAGLGAYHATWDGVREVLARNATPKARVCAYDRWGLGGSDEHPGGRQSISQAGAELRTLLLAAGIRPPYVLVGHSIAGLIHRHYTLMHPDEITGLVMVDTVPDDWDVRLNRSEFIGGGETLSYGHEAVTLEKDNLGARPTIVVQAEKTAYLDPSPEFGEYWHKSQKVLAALSTNSILVTAVGSDHLVPDVRPELVARAIGLVVDSARTGKPLPACASSGLTSVHGGC